MSNISRRAFVAGVTMLSLNLIGCSNNAPTQKKAPTNVNVVCKVYQKGLKEDCSFLILHLVGCCAKTKGIDKVFSFTYDDIVNNNVCFSTTAGKYHLYIIPPTTEGMIYTTKLERSVVLTGETKEEHIKNKAEAEGITEEEAKAKMDASEKQSLEEGHPYEEWCGTLVEIYLRKQQLPLDTDEKVQLDKNISDIKSLTNLYNDVLDTVVQRVGGLNET
jgi:hypothetical protein